MLAAGLLAHALCGARQHGLGRRALAAASVGWRLLQSGDGGPTAASFSLSAAGNAGGSLGGCSFSSSAVSGSGAAGSFANGISRGNDPPAKRGRGKLSHTREPQPQLQAWLQQQQGLPAAEADEYARRLSEIYETQQAALEGLPTTFEWCRSRGLTGLQVAQLLDGIGKKRRESVKHFAAEATPAWQLMDSHIAAYVEQLRQAGDRKLRKRSSLAGVLCSSGKATEALGMPPRHVEAWLAAVSEQLGDAAVGRLVLSNPIVVTATHSTALAAVSWAADVLGVADPAAFFARAPDLLCRKVAALQHKVGSLQQVLGWTAEAVRQLVLKQPLILTSSTDTTEAAAAWLRRHITDAEQMADVIDRGSRLLGRSDQHLQANADYLRQALGWQDGDGQLAAFVAAHPSDFAAVSLSSEDTQHKLQLFSEVVGISPEQCLSCGITYLNRGLETICAQYMLVQERAPQLLYGRSGGMSLKWTKSANQPHYLTAMGMTRPEYNAFVREWPHSEEGRRLLEGLRSGSVEGWPRPPSWQEAQQRRQRAATQRDGSGGGRRRQSIGAGGQALR